MIHNIVFMVTIKTNWKLQQDAYEFLVNWFNAFPEYKTNKFYITGESYAGIYIPMMMEQIMNDPLNAKINLLGAAIGNGCWGNTVGTCAFSSTDAYQISSDFYFGHGMFSQKTKSAIDASCGDWSKFTPACLAALKVMEAETGNFDM